ncbi:MAG: type I-E CRISPR-associated protein Cse1/CasA [Oscillospiraceae bacterium]|nr:type I-E CRISPR-associated protein Cse1/CasA [Oscillospiraceae bacterium]
MAEMKYNLLDEPWIRVMGENCAVTEVSITDALINAHRYSALAGETPAQDVAILRLLIAIVHTVFYRADESGCPATLTGYDDALDRWEALWHADALPEMPIRSYLDTWHDRFDLLDPDRPFYQVPEAKIGTPHTAAKLNGTILQSENKIRVFSGRTSETSGTLSIAEAARWLIYLQGFDDASVKPKTEAGKKNVKNKPGSARGWLGNLGVIYTLGDSLFQTIMLNLFFLKDGAELYSQPKPCWERESPWTTEYAYIPVPDNIPELFTLQSRRVLLERVENQILGFMEYCGDLIDPKNAFDEPMTVWRPIKEKNKIVGYIPKPHAAARKLWRDFSTVAIQSEENRRPGVTNWLTSLQEQRCLSEAFLIRFSAVTAHYDSSGSSVTDTTSDSLSFHADLLTEVGGAWQLKIKDQIEFADKAAYVLSILAGELAIAAGMREISNGKAVPADRMSAAEKAKTQYYYRIDEAFRKWLLKPEAGQNADIRDELCSDWRATAVCIAREVAREEVDRTGLPALTGRWVEIEKNGAATKRHYSAAEAYNRFNSRIKKLMEGGT